MILKTIILAGILIGGAKYWTREAAQEKLMAFIYPPNSVLLKASPSNPLFKPEEPNIGFTPALGILTIEEAKIEEETRYDGKWVLRTNTELPTDIVALKYKELL